MYECVGLVSNDFVGILRSQSKVERYPAMPSHSALELLDYRKPLHAAIRLSRHPLLTIA
ncbi:MAG: hypothetical protein KME27_30475 [Lyngbya sp. HA4199-MV5]|nr:hypothetical protein [Lyngbya sp. HA4199-MV5]